jgi:hypothetical protein
MYACKGRTVTRPPVGNRVASPSVEDDTERQIRNLEPKKQASVSEYTRPHERSAKRYP